MASYHVRSNSFPSRPHPITSEVDQLLCRLTSSQTATTSSLCNEINSLEDLHSCVDKWIQLPHVQQALGQEDQRKSVDELLNGSLMILDISNISQEFLSQMKESIQGLQSVLRRRRCDEVSSEVKKYIASRKAVKKTIKKALKSIENRYSSKTSEEHETIKMLKEVESVTLTVFKSLLSLISGPKASSKSGLSLVSKLIQPKRIACEEENANEFAKVDSTLSNLTSKLDNFTHVQSLLKDLESTIQDVEGRIECLSRHLIKTRVSLLNIINN